MEIAADVVKVLRRHPDVNPEKINLVLHLDASFLGHLLRPETNVKNQVINNIFNNVRNDNDLILSLLRKARLQDYDIYARHTSNGPVPRVSYFQYGTSS